MMIAVGPCVVCGRLFRFDPDRVPSIVIEGERKPVCRTCILRANTILRERGEPEHEILPGAYPDDDDPV